MVERLKVERNYRKTALPTPLVFMYITIDRNDKVNNWRGTISCYGDNQSNAS